MESAVNGSSESLSLMPEDDFLETMADRYYKISAMRLRWLGLDLLSLLLPLALALDWLRAKGAGLERAAARAAALLAARLPAARLPRLRLGQQRGGDGVRGGPCVEIQVLHDPGDGPRADVIFVHGINGALEKTWTQGVNSPNTDLVGELSKCWPRDWLPVDCPSVRVIAVNYTTDPYLWRPFWVQQEIRTPMSERSWEMMDSLTKVGVGENCIIWVGHSKGGLYVKQILVNSCETLEARYRRLGWATRGVLFYSVPHRGSPLANLNLPLLRQSIELVEVQKDCAEVLTLHEKFKKLVDTEQLKLNVKSFIETQHTLLSFIYLRIVSEESADAQVGEKIGVPLDHRNICKPRSRECFLYRELVNLIEAICNEMSS